MWHHEFKPSSSGQRRVPPVAKLLVTAGLSLVTLLSLVWPELASHQGVLVLAFTTNLVWIWS